MRPTRGRRSRKCRLGTAAALVVAAVFGSLAFQASGAPGPALAAGTPAEELAARYAPIVYLREQEDECDSDGEPYAPSAVEMVLGRPDVALRRVSDGSLVMMAPTAADIAGRPEDDVYLDLPGDPKRPGCEFERYFRAASDEYKNVTYARIVTQEDRPGEIVLQYWFYYIFNDWNNTHESDWEFIQLVFKANTLEEALAGTPDRVGYSAHSGGERAGWGDGKLEREGDRPAVYVGAGSHANQYSSDLFLGKAEDGAGFGCDDASDPVRRTEPRVVLLPQEPPAARDPFAWLTYEGRWGEKRASELDGPTGPNTKKQWDQPLLWDDELREGNLAVPGADRGGPNAAMMFCSVVSNGSKILLRGGLWIGLAAVVLLVGSITTTAARTDFFPSQAQPLQRRRRYGQILTVAFRILFGSWRAFLPVALLFPVIGMAVSFLQGVFFDFEPVERLSELTDSRAGDAILAIAAGALQFGIAYWVVLIASTAALAEIASGGNAGGWAGYALAWRRIGALVLARGRALMMVFLLTISIIGIPWAFWKGARWSFVEHAVLIEGLGPNEAKLRSEAVVGRHWIYVTGAVVSIAMLGIVSGPLAGAFAVLLTSAPLRAINIVAALVYAVLIPWVAIALSLLFWSLKAEAEEQRQGP